MNKILSGGSSDRGRVRRHNEDRWLADPHAGLFLVSDGLGGHAAGAQAAELVASSVVPLVRSHLRAISCLSDPRAADRLRAALAELNRRVCLEGQCQPALYGMGATIVLALVRDEQALIAHVGDSRAYLGRDGDVRPLTRDHSPLQRLLDAGQISPAQAVNHPQAGLLSQYLGQSADVTADVVHLELEPGDQLLLCSDGLSGALSLAEIRGLLGLGLPPGVVCGLLVDAANLRGGEDNVTAVLVALEQGPRAGRSRRQLHPLASERVCPAATAEQASELPDPAYP